MQFNIILKENSPYTHYCPRPLITDDVRAYRVVIKTEQILEGAHLLITAVRSDGQAVTDMGEMYGGYGEYTLAGNMYSVEGEMRLLITVVDYDGAALTAKEVIFTVVQGGANNAIDGDDRMPVLNGMIADCNNVINRCNELEYIFNTMFENGTIGIDNLNDEIITTHTNLLNSDNIYSGGFPCSFSIELTPGKIYCCNIPESQLFYGVHYLGDSSLEDHPYTSIDGGFSFVMTDLSPTNTLVVQFYNDVDVSKLMLVEGTTLPKHYIPFGESKAINNNLLNSVYKEIEETKLICEDASLTEIEGLTRLPLRVGKIYNLTLNENTNFWLPQVATESDQIVVRANLTTDIAIDWGTTWFYNGEVPDIPTPTGTYEFLFSYINGHWVVGVLPYGEVVA